MGDFFWLLEKIARFGKHFNNPSLRRKHCLSGKLCVFVLRVCALHPGRHSVDDPAVFAQDGAGGQVEFSPPYDVGDIAEGGHHGNTGSFVLLGQVVGLDRNLDAKEGAPDRLTKEVLVTRVIRVGHKRHTGGDELWPRRHNGDALAGIGAVE